MLVTTLSRCILEVLAVISMATICVHAEHFESKHDGIDLVMSW